MSSAVPPAPMAELRQILDRHDREHPDHPEDCECENGVVTMLRKFFAESPAPMAPDVAPDDATDEDYAPADWRALLPGETEEERVVRVAQSCPTCGTFIVSEVARKTHVLACDDTAPDLRWAL